LDDGSSATSHPGNGERTLRWSGLFRQLIGDFKVGSATPLNYRPIGLYLTVKSSSSNGIKGERRSNFSVWEGRERVVPLGYVFAGGDVDSGHLLVGDVDAGLVLLAVDLGGDG
jgi:hypothetical protein